LLRAQPSQEIPELAAADGIHAERRLVEQDNLRLMDEAARERQLLLHAAGKAPAQAVRKFRQPGKFQERRDAPLLLRKAHAVDIGEEAHVLHHGEVGGQGELLRDVPDPFADGVRVTHGIVSQDGAFARRAAQQPQDDARRRRLPGAIGPDETERLAAPHFQGDAVHGFHRPPSRVEGFDQILSSDCDVHKSN